MDKVPYERRAEGSDEASRVHSEGRTFYLVQSLVGGGEGRDKGGGGEACVTCV